MTTDTTEACMTGNGHADDIILPNHLRSNNLFIAFWQEVLFTVAREWRATIAIIYCIILVMDFIVFPAYVGLNKIPLNELVVQLSNLEPNVQLKLIDSAYSDYQPLTLMGGALVHVALGAIVTGSAITGNKSMFKS